MLVREKLLRLFAIDGADLSIVFNRFRRIRSGRVYMEIVELRVRPYSKHKRAKAHEIEELV